MVQLSIIVLLFIATGYRLTSGSYLQINGLSHKVYKSKDGSIFLGAMFPLHNHGTDEEFCGKTRELGVLQRVEAMAYFIDEYNTDFKLHHKIGFYILDDCYTQKTALAQGLHFVQSENRSCTQALNNTCSACSPPNDALSLYDVVGVIGSESSSVSIELAQLFGLFQIPQISYMSTANKLTENNKYPFFNRIPSPDRNQVDILITLFEKLNWSYISMVYAGNDYGKSAYEEMQARLDRHPTICLGKGIEMGLSTNETDHETIYSKLTAAAPGRDFPKVVVLFINQPQATGLFTTGQRLNKTGIFTYVGSDAWGRSIQDFDGLEDILNGTLLIKIKSDPDRKFSRAFKKLTPATHTANPWFNEFWELHHNCPIENCSKSLRFGEDSGWQAETTISLLKESVRLFAALVDWAITECKADKSGTDCTMEEMQPFLDSTRLQNMLRSRPNCTIDVKLSGKCFSIGPDGNSVDTGYTIQNYFIDYSGKSRIRELGDIEYEDYKDFTIDLSNNSLSWHPNVTLVTVVAQGYAIPSPKTICSEQCSVHNEQKSDQTMGKCCWECVECSDTQRSYTDSLTAALKCEECQPQPSECGHCQASMSDETVCVYKRSSSDTCEIIMPRTVSWEEPVSISLISINYVLALGTIVVLILYFINREKSLIKATSKELSYITFSGTLLAFGSSAIFFVSPIEGCQSVDDCTNPKPIVAYCYLQYICFSLSFTMTYAPILTRIIRIHRIFSHGRKSVKRPKFVEQKYQLIFTSIFILIQCVIMGICIIISRSENNGIRVDSCTEREDLKGLVTCQISTPMLLPSVIYNFLIVLGCAVFAFKTRKLPDNYNEAKFMVLCVYTACVMWAAFLSVYLLIQDHAFKVVPLVAVMTTNSAVAIGSLFIPKLYAIYFVKNRDMNIRSASVSDMGGSFSGPNSRRNSKFATYTAAGEEEVIRSNGKIEKRLSFDLNLESAITDLSMNVSSTDSNETTLNGNENGSAQQDDS